MRKFLFKLKIIVYLELVLLVILFVRWGKAVWLQDNAGKIAAFLILLVAVVVIYIKRKKMIDRAVNEFWHCKNQELREKIPQLEAKKGLISSLVYLVKEMGFGRRMAPKAKITQELADLGSAWLKEHLAEMMHRYEKLASFFINSFLPVVKSVIFSSAKKGEVFVGASIGCGIGLFEQKIAEWCNKKKLSSIIIATDPNKSLLLKLQKNLRKKRISTIFWANKEKINLQKIISGAEKSGKCLVCLAAVSVEQFTEFLPSKRKLNLVWFFNSREHTIEGRPQIFNQIKQCTKGWAILELLRDWRAIFFSNLISWWYSPIFAAETEISVSRSFTLQEWLSKDLGGKKVIIKRFCTAWIMSEGVYRAIKCSPVRVRAANPIFVPRSNY